MHNHAKQFVDTPGDQRDYASRAATSAICDLLNSITGGLASMLRGPCVSFRLTDRAALEVVSIDRIMSDTVRITRQVWNDRRGTYSELLRCYAVVTKAGVREIMDADWEPVDVLTRKMLFGTLGIAREQIAARELDRWRVRA